MNVIKYILFILFFFLIGFWYLFSVNKHKNEINLEKNITEIKSTLYKFNEDEQIQYKLEFSQNSSLLANEILPKGVNYRYDLSATLNVRIIEKDTSFVWLAFKLSPLELRGAWTSNHILKKLLPYYKSMFLVKVNYSGVVKEIHFPGKAINFNGLSQLVYLLEVVNTKDKNYKYQEKDMLGLYQSFYRKKSYYLQKQKKFYKRVDNPDKNYNIDIKQFNLSATIDENNSWLLDLELEERLLIKDERNRPYAKNINSIWLEKIYTKIDETLDIWKEKRNLKEILKEFKKSDENDQDIFKIIEKENDKKQFIQDKITINKLIDELKLAPKNTSLYRKIGKFISVFPDSTNSLKNIILKSNDNISMSLISMLSKIATFEAQVLLANIANNDYTSNMNNIRAIIALGGVKKAIPDTIRSLIKISSRRGDIDLNDKSDTALLALSSQVRDNKKINYDIVSYIKSEYSSNLSLSKEKNVLYAMQNAGADNFIDEITESLSSHSSKVRLIAINTLATIMDKALRDDILKKHLVTEKENKIKNEINRLILYK